MIFVDTSFWVALRNTRDSNHDTAVALLKQHADGTLLTTNHVRGETWTFLRRRAGHASAVNFLDTLVASTRVTVDTVDASTESGALEWLRVRDEREYSFVDATSFATMRSRRLTRAFAFDGDFTAAGFVELRPAP